MANVSVRPSMVMVVVPGCPGTPVAGAPGARLPRWARGPPLPDDAGPAVGDARPRVESGVVGDEDAASETSVELRVPVNGLETSRRPDWVTAVPRIVSPAVVPSYRVLCCALEGLERPGWRHNLGWERGIRTGSAATGWVDSFILDHEAPDGSGIEFLAADHEGNIYVGEGGRQRLAKYIRVR